MLNNMRPSVRLKRFYNELYYTMKGNETRRKAEYELSKLKRPVYKISEEIKNKTTI